MGKKGTKKINRKVRRSARKTLGILTLIMAIIVAAIPIPDARADDPDDGDGGTQSSLEPPVYPEEADIPFPSVVPTPATTTRYKAQLIYKSGGTYYLYDVFDYYMQGTGGNVFGCISSYNDAYQPENGKLEIPGSVVHDYPAFTEQEVVDYFTTNRSEVLNDDDLARYYKSEWDEWQRYLSDKAIWDSLTADQQNSGRYPNPGNKTKPSHTVGEFLISGDQWVSETGLRYFCTHFNGTYAASNGTDRISINLAPDLGNRTEYTLIQVTDERRSTPTQAAIRYIPCEVGASVDNNKDYSSKFYCPSGNACHIRYIGEGAFKDATSITQLVIPDDILAIGDEAFMGCSGLTTVSAYAGKIGNRAFKNCASLKDVTLGEGVSEIGTECFYGCNQLASISFPGTMEEIGFGAFAYCMNLGKIEMDKINTNVVLGDYCFFDCPSISNVTFAPNMSEIGNAVFAVTDDVPLRSTSWRNIVFPDNVRKLGEYVLYGRWNVETVVMPAAFGTNRAPAEDNVLGKGFFGKCSNLKYVEFPDNGGGSCGFVTFDEDAFADVLSEDFYIRGPELNVNRQIASPRESAWNAGITYVYKDRNGVDQYEISNGTYRFTVDKDGILTNCTLLKENEWEAEGSKIVVPSTVGNRKVTGIGPDCFSSETIRNKLKELRIEDGSDIKSIADHAFEGYSALEIVYIGDSINEIGASAFADCTKLQTVVFSTPKGGYLNFKIGPNAFATRSAQLTFYGDIVKGYAPFDWAMSKDNWMDQNAQLRVCYCSGTPDHPNLKVMLDNKTGLVTLVGYPHYEDLDEVTRYLYECSRDGIEPNPYYPNPGPGTNPDPGNTDTPTPDPSNPPVPTDPPASGNPSNTIPTTLTAEQEKWVQNTLNIVIPDGIESIDVQSFLSARENDADRRAYLSGSNDYLSEYTQNGLFRGNEDILSVTMNSVKFLPDRAFEDCKNLEAVSLGSGLEDIGTAPFTGCDKLVSVGGNNNYPCENGIIYEKNDTGYTIIECLPARGNLVGQTGVDATSDPRIAQVTKINPGAFENCAYVVDVNLQSAVKLEQIPDNCFDSAEKLMSVELPESVNKIGERAFANTGAYTVVTIPAIEVDIADSAFDDCEPASVVLYSYKDSAVASYANRKHFDFREIGKSYRVQFVDYNGDVLPVVDKNGNKIYVQYILPGNSAKAPENPTGGPAGYVFDRWNKNFEEVDSDMIITALYRWGYPNTSPGVLPNTSPGANGGNNNNNGTPTPGPGTPGAGTPGAGTPGAGTPGAGTPGAGTPGASNGQTSNQRYKLTVENGTGDGTYLAGTTVVITADAPPSGQRFDRWTSIANDFNITSATSSITTITMPSHDMTIVANYTTGSGSSNGNNGNSSNISSNTNGNSGGTTVDITKPGISDTDVASATVDGSTDNYVVKITDTAEARAAVEAALINEYGTLDNLRYFAMDISLYDSTGTVKITDTSNISVNITMPIPDELRIYAGNNQVAGVVNGNVLDKLSPRFTTINGVPCISFTATHFSPYTVYVDTSNLSAGVSDSTPKTGDMIHPKWFLSIALACISLILLLKKDKKQAKVKTA